MPVAVRARKKTAKPVSGWTLNFQPQFEPHVKDGSKTHSIRGERKDGKVPVAGMTVHCYAGLRHRGARLLGRWVCVKVERISIGQIAKLSMAREYASRRPPLRLVVVIDGETLSTDECDALAYRDGFRDVGVDSPFQQMMEFWAGRLPFKGYVIHWDYSKPVVKQVKKRKAA